VGIARAGRSYTYLFGRAIGVEPGAPIVDVQSVLPYFVDIDGDPDPSYARNRRELRLWGHLGSAFEHLVWEELVGTEFVSTVKGIQLVKERFPAQSVQSFSGTPSSTVNTILGGFRFDTISDDSITEIGDFAADPNHTATTPIAAVTSGASPLDVYIRETHKTTPPAEISIGMRIRVGDQTAGGSCQLQECGGFPEGEEPPGLLDLFLTLLSRLRAISIGAVDGDASLPPPQDPSGVSETLAGDPVSMVSGNLHHREQDLVLPTDGPPFSLTRTYNSQIDDVGALGVGWMHSYEMRVEPAQDTRIFTYLPTSLSDFANLNQVAGPRSDTLDTSNVGGGTETVTWGVLPPAFTTAVQEVESIDLELAYSGNGSTVTPNTGQDPVTLPATGSAPFAFKTIELKNGAEDPYVSLASPIQVTFGAFNSSDRLYFARLRIRYRGPTIERVPLVANTFTGWTDGGAKLKDDEDPSSCSPPTGDQATISYLSPGILDGIFGYELIVSVDRTPTTGSRTSTLYRGTPAAGEAFATGPVVGGKGARQRFMTTNATEQLVVTFDREVGSSGTPENQLCLVSYRALTMPQQVEFVREDGARERFTKNAGVWEAAPGVRSRLEEIAGGYQISRVDGQILRFEQDGSDGAELLTRISDPQGRSLDLTYVGGLLDKVTWANSPSPEPEALQFRYANGYLDYVEDWNVPTKRKWDFTVDPNGDLREVRDPLESSNLPNPLTGRTYDYLSGQENEKLNHNLRRITFPKDVVAPVGGDHQIEFEYDNSDRVISQSDSLGNRQTFAYNVAGQESQTTDPRGFTTIYRYDTQANLTQRVDPDGAVLTWAYDGDRNVTSETDPFGKTRFFSGYSYEHDEVRGKPATITDRDGRSIQLTYDPDSGAPATLTDKRDNVRTTQFFQGQPVQVTATLGAAAPLLIENEYDPASRRLDKIFQPFGDGSGREAITVFSYFPGNRDIQFIDLWEDDGDRVLGEPQDDLLSRTEFEYDALGRRKARTIQRATAPNDPSPIPIRTEVERNLRGQIERVIRPDGAAWVLEYDRNENLQAQFLEVTGPDGTLSVQQRLDFRYDVLDRLKEVEDALGGITRFEYDAAGNRIATVDPKGNRSRIEYDSKNRPVRRIDANGAVTTTEYDAAGRVVAETDPTGVTTRLSYDEIGLLASLQEGGSQAATRQVIYDDPAPGDLRHELIDPNQELTNFVFDDLGRITQVIDAGTPAGLTQIEYDLHGNLTRFTDPEGGETRFIFDAAGRVKEDQPPYATGPYETDYDETGNATRVTKPDGCQIEMTYDKMGRVVDRISTASCPPEVIGIHDRFGYDARGNLMVAKNTEVALIREYDELDRLVREIDSRFGTAVGYVYDAASRVTGIVYPDDSVAHLAYDPAGRTTGITDPFRDTTRYSYDAAGRRVQTRGTSGLETDLRYDADGRLELIESRRTDGSLAASHAYSNYDDAGNRGQLVNGFGTTVYAYDALQRLEAITPPGQPTNHFGYDRAGNRTQSGNQVGGSWTAPYTNYFYDNQPGDVTHRITRVETHAGTVLHSFPTYDPNGNPTQWDFGGSRTLRWDALDRLAAIEIEGGFTGTYAYDPFGRRIAKMEQGATVRYQYDGIDAVAEYDGADALQATYVYGPGIDEPIKIERGETAAALHSDGLGSIVAVSDVDAPAGGDLATYRYGAFGEDEDPPGGFEHPYGFTGRERDASGLYYYRARYYLPAIGRFLTPDPIGLAGGVNPYSYVNSNPVNFRDPFGLVPGETGTNETIPAALPETGESDSGSLDPTSEIILAGTLITLADRIFDLDSVEDLKDLGRADPGTLDRISKGKDVGGKTPTVEQQRKARKAQKFLGQSGGRKVRGGPVRGRGPRGGLRTNAIAFGLELLNEILYQLFPPTPEELMQECASSPDCT
jgi:RHS repeat-associated protein